MRNPIIRPAILLSAAILTLAACDSTLQEKGMGKLSLEVAIGNETTRAAMSEDEVISSAKVKIYKADFSGLVRQYLKSEMPRKEGPFLRSRRVGTRKRQGSRRSANIPSEPWCPSVL